MRQIALPLFNDRIISFSDVISHPGISGSLQLLQSALAEISVLNSEMRQIIIYGLPGSGKTTILKASYEFLKNGEPAAYPSSFFVPATDRSMCESTLELLIRMPHDELSMVNLVCIDDVDKVGEPESNHLWTLWNRLLVEGSNLICASSLAPEELFAQNPHLRSRMLWGLSLELKPPDDSFRVIILDKMASLRGIRLTHDVINYLLSRKSRNLKKLEDLLDVLDEVSLEEKRRVTLRLIKELEVKGLL